MAIVILAGMLLLGLPFLFSQSASLTGTRSFAHSQIAQVGRTTAEDMGIGASADSIKNIFTQGRTTEMSSLLDSINYSTAQPYDPRRIFVDLSSSGHGWNASDTRNAAVIGLSIQDESGKLNPNYMSVKAWERLLNACLIADWDDGTGDNKDEDNIGQLASALAHARYKLNICPEGYLTRFEQLLEVIPEPPGIRWPLTRAELAQIRPYLTLASHGPGRDGIIDLGTWIKKPNSGNNANLTLLDAVHPSQILGFPTAFELFSAGTVLVVDPKSQAGSSQFPHKYWFGLSSSLDLDSEIKWNPKPPQVKPNQLVALGIAAPPPINAHETSKPVRETLWEFNQTDGRRPDVLANMGDILSANGNKDKLNRDITGLLLQNPLGPYDAPNQSTLRKLASPQQSASVQASRKGDPGVNDDNLTANTLSADARRIWLNLNGGVTWNKIPNRGYARIEAQPDPTAPANTQKVFEIIYYNWKDRTSGDHIGGIRRGLSFPETVGAIDHPAGTDIIFIEPTELQPLAIASQGIFAIESGSSATDAAGKQSAQQFRRTIVQAVPQEELLEMRWEKQSQYHALLVQRHGSLMNAFPSGYQRLIDEKPDNTMLGFDSNDLDHNVGVRPGILRSILTSGHLRMGRNRDDSYWSRSFSREVSGDDPFIQGSQENLGLLTSHNYTRDLSPEGLKVFNGPIGYQASTGTEGVFTYQTAVAAPSLDGRQIGFWVKPSTQIQGNVTLFDFRSPSNKAGERLGAQIGPDGRQTPEPGSNYYQNRITLTYADSVKQLVLTVANAAVEHLYDHGPILSPEEFRFDGAMSMTPPSPLGPYVDPRCLGTQIAPFAKAGVNPLAPLRPLNVVQHRYQLDKMDGLKKNMWHFVQVVFVGNDPGHLSIVVNGIVGKDVTRSGLSTPVMKDVGDHMTLPSMILQTALPATPDVKANGAAALVIPTITVNALAFDPDSHAEISGADALKRILPKRGVVRIGNEFISYENIIGNTLVDCLRARRQDSFIDLPAADLYAWVQLEKHDQGDLVYAGGIRFNPGSTGHLWHGECKLSQPFRNGDVLESYRMWTELDKPTGIDIDSGRPAVLAADTTIKVKGGLIADWPPRGYVRIRLNGQPDEIIYYDNGGGPPGMTLNNVVRAQLGTTAQLILWPNTAMPTPDEIPNLYLCSFEVDSNPVGSFPPEITVPAQPLLPPWQRPPPPETLLVQLTHTATQRIEWIQYTDLAEQMGHFFFVDGINEFRFDPARRSNGSRAQQRTAFAATDLPGGDIMIFDAQSSVLPVQTSLNRAHVLVTGDLFTILPKQPTGNSQQACIRYAATDGFHLTAGTQPTTPGDNTWDTVNRYFSFTEKLSRKWEDNDFTMVSWPGWSGNDLTAEGHGIPAGNNNLLPYFTMPLATAFAQSNSVYFGGDDPGNTFANAPNVTPNASGQLVVDALYAGVQPGGVGRPNPFDNLVAAFGTSATNMKPVYVQATTNTPAKSVTWLLATAKLSGNEFIQTTNDLFYNDLGLIKIGGEVFAYERQTNVQNGGRQIVKLIGRSLLGSVASPHTGPEPVMILPIGPVTRLVRPLREKGQPEEIFLTPHSRTRLNPDTQDDPNAPALMFCSSDGQKMELFVMPDRHTAPWLRGMYNTTVQNWAAGNVDTFVIGWWPRYPSGHPNKASTVWGSADQSNALLRNRMYAWMGFPIRFHNMYLNGGNALVELSLLDDGAGTYNVSASAITEGFDWNESRNNSFPLSPTGAPMDASSIFSRYAERPIDGVEVRVRFEYRNPPANPQSNVAAFLQQVAVNGNTAPMLGKTKLRARAPTKILHVEEAR